MVGETVAHYRVLSELGRGGMGVVFLADDLALNRPVALKFIRGDGFGDAEADARLLREARAAGALDHPNVATIYEIGESEGTHFIATEFIDGRTLTEYAKLSPPVTNPHWRLLFRWLRHCMKLIRRG